MTPEMEAIAHYCDRKNITLEMYYLRLSLRRWSSVTHGDSDRVEKCESQMRAVCEWRDSDPERVERFDVHEMVDESAMLTDLDRALGI